ncbi:hypothetical protein LSAT2_029059, partial [Lamellibrachia satsuma]
AVTSPETVARPGIIWSLGSSWDRLVTRSPWDHLVIRVALGLSGHPDRPEIIWSSGSS